MSATELALRYAKAVRGKSLSSFQAAQVNHGSQFLLLRPADFDRVTSSQNIDHALVQIRGGHFDRMTRQRSSVEGAEPAGAEIVPRTVGHNGVITDAILAGLDESSVRELKHAERT